MFELCICKGSVSIRNRPSKSESYNRISLNMQISRVFKAISLHPALALDMDYFCVEWKKYLFAELFIFLGLYSVQTEEMGAFS